MKLDDEKENKLTAEIQTDPARDNKIPLDAETAKEIRRLRKNIRENLIAMIEKAHTIRMQRLGEKGKGYSADFHRWWRKNDLQPEFGTLANFTKYALAGEAWEKAAAQGYRDRLPLTLNGLHEVSRYTSDEVKLAIQNTYTRISPTATPTAPKIPKPVIHPEATHRQIQKWLERWREPSPISKPSHDNVTLEELADIEKAMTKALKSWQGYEVAKELKEVLERARRRLQRAEKKAAKKSKGGGMAE
jgi:hypothetical protein